MPITLAKIANNTAQVTLSVGEDSVTITYFPARITEKTVASLQMFMDANESNLADSFAGLNSILTTLIKDWDVYENEAQTIMFPIDASRLEELPIMFRLQVVSAIMRDVRPESVAA